FTYTIDDGQGGTAVATVNITVEVATSGTEVYSNTTAIAVPDESTILSTIEVTDNFTIADLNVQLDITHARAQDLDVFLISPTGTRIELFTDVGGNGGNFTNTGLDDEAPTSIAGGSAPFTGVYRPEGDLSILDGETTIGTWTLEITDDKKNEAGTLNSWSLTIEWGTPLTAAAPAESVSAEAAPILTTAELDPIVNEAIRRWSGSGLLDAEQLQALATIEFEISSLAGATLGLTTADTIVIDVDAAGYGWYVDPTPADDLEFGTQDDDVLLATAGNDAAGRLDLLTAVIHEIGHYLGFGHADSSDEPGVMDETLAAGERGVLSPVSAAVITAEVISNDIYLGPIADGHDVHPGVISESDGSAEVPRHTAVLKAEISSHAATALLRTGAALASAPVTINTAETVGRVATIGTADTGDPPGADYPVEANAWPRTAPVIRGSDPPTVMIDIKLEPGMASDMPAVAIADTFYPYGHIARDFAVFIYQGELNRGERRIVYVQRRPERRPRGDPAKFRGTKIAQMQQPRCSGSRARLAA
ncbi:MAG: proprotein convertase P-domain-containing protein, partial [Proteobacteria bacterium]|nr:proprotein convertase P-domain-containing protein [Pseudomonadota bacterium]